MYCKFSQIRLLLLRLHLKSRIKSYICPLTKCEYIRKQALTQKPLGGYISMHTLMEQHSVDISAIVQERLNNLEQV